MGTDLVMFSKSTKSKFQIVLFSLTSGNTVLGNSQAFVNNLFLP